MNKSKFFLILISSLLISCANPNDPDGGDGTGGGTTPDGNPSWYLTAEQQAVPFSMGPTVVFPTISAQQHRIPAIIVANNGNIVALCDNRHNADIDVGSDHLLDTSYKISKDGGKTWSSENVILPLSTSIDDNKGDPLVFKTKTGDLVLLAVGGGAWAGAPATPAKIWTSRSTDNGETWSKWAIANGSEEIYKTSSITANKGFPASGRGLTTKGGKLVAAMLVQNSAGQNAALCIYSDDDGNTWKAGGLVSKGAVDKEMNEPKVIAELSDGTLLMSIRPNGVGKRQWSTSKDGGLTWTQSSNDPVLQDGDGNGEGVVWTTTASGHDKNRIAHVSLVGANRRKGLSLSISEDEGKTFTTKLVLQEGDSCYSSIDVLPDGTIVVLGEEKKQDPAEGSWLNGYYDVVFRRYNLKAITGETYDTAWYKQVK